MAKRPARRVSFHVAGGHYAGDRFVQLSRTQVRLERAVGSATVYEFASSRWWPVMAEKRSTYAVKMDSQLHRLLTRAALLEATK